MMSYYSICVPSVYFWPFVSSFLTVCQWIAEISCLFKDFLIILICIHPYQSGFLSIIMIDSYQIPVICHTQVGIIVKVFLLKDAHSSYFFLSLIQPFRDCITQFYQVVQLILAHIFNFLHWEGHFDCIVSIIPVLWTTHTVSCGGCIHILDVVDDFFLCHISVHFLFLIQRYNKKTRPPNFSSLFYKKNWPSLFDSQFRSSSSWYLLH